MYRGNLCASKLCYETPVSSAWLKNPALSLKSHQEACISHNSTNAQLKCCVFMCLVQLQQERFHIQYVKNVIVQ